MIDLSNVLNYKEDELRDMSNSDLELLLEESLSKESLFNTRQLVEKTLINSLN